MGQPCAPERVLHLIRQKRTVACRHCRGCSRIRLCQNFAQRHAQRRLHPFRPSPKRTALPLWQKAVQIFSRQKNAVCVIAVCIFVFFQFRELHARRKAFARQSLRQRKKIHPKRAHSHAVHFVHKNTGPNGIFKKARRRFHNRCVDLRLCSGARLNGSHHPCKRRHAQQQRRARNGACQHGVSAEPSAQFPGWKNGRKKNGRQRPKSRWRQKGCKQLYYKI